MPSHSKLKLREVTSGWKESRAHERANAGAIDPSRAYVSTSRQGVSTRASTTTFPLFGKSERACCPCTCRTPGVLWEFHCEQREGSCPNGREALRVATAWNWMANHHLHEVRQPLMTAPANLVWLQDGRMCEAPGLASLNHAPRRDAAADNFTRPLLLFLPFYFRITNLHGNVVRPMRAPRLPASQAT